MKNLILLHIVFLAGVLILSSQTKVEKSLYYSRTGDYNSAMKEISEAVKYPDLSGLATTWYYRGKIYQEAFMKDESKVYALDTAYFSLVKAMTLDPDQDYLKNIIAQLKMLSTNYYRKGALDFNDGKYAFAYQSFERALDINKTPMIAFSDSGLLFHAGNAAYLSGNYTKAKKHFQKLTGIKVKTMDVYNILGDIYLNENNIAMAIETYDSGLDAGSIYSGSLVLKLINICLKYGKTEEAEKYIEKGKKIDPANAQIHFYEAGLYNLQLQDEKAISAYKRGMLYEPDNYDANYNTGILLYNNAIIHKELADKFKNSDDLKFKQERSEFNNLIMESLKYLEKAYSLDKKDRNLNYCLLDVYKRLNRPTEAEKVEANMKLQKIY
ncbi:MAG: tetratricopeptide repeat protein [Bacteroidota bacterium]